MFWWDDKPWWIDSSSAKNRYYYDFGDGSGPPEKLAIDKHTPHFMNGHGFGWHSKVIKTFFRLYGGLSLYTGTRKRFEIKTALRMLKGFELENTINLSGFKIQG